MAQETIEESSTEVSEPIVRDTASKTVRRKTFTQLYKDFRQSGLSKTDSAFNALYICQTEKFCSKRVKVNNVGEGYFDHPVGWFKEKEERIRRATRTKTLRFLELVAKVLSPFSKSVEYINARSGFFFDNSFVTMRNAAGSFKKAVPACAVIVCATVLFSAVYFDSQKQAVIEFSVDGVVQGRVSSVSTVDEALERVTASISSVTNKMFSFPYEISYTMKNVRNADCLDVNGVYDILSGYTDSYTTPGYGLYIDSKLIAVLENRDDIVQTLEQVKSEHMLLTGEEEDIANRIEIKYRDYTPESLTTKEALLSMFSAEKPIQEEPMQQRALLAQPTTLSTISLEGITPEFQESIEGSIASNSTNAIVLDFQVNYTETVRETVLYDTEYIESDAFYQGQEVVITSGRNGSADNTYSVKYVNGAETGRDLISQEIVKAPRTAVIKVGTRVLPESLSEDEVNGKYMINPVPAGKITSYFGWRILRGRSDYHEAIDFAAPEGTSIYACASGEVIFAGYNSSYGNHIKIRHEDGKVTLYAHCSELLVEVGDVVSQADLIGLVGSTGDSTGDHCHLEVRINDKRVDPEDYIYSLD